MPHGGPALNVLRLSFPGDSEGLRAGIRAGLPFAAAAFFLGISFGVIARPVIGGGTAVVMSAIVFAGSSQFAAVAVLAAGGAPLAAITAGILLNLRYVPMGIALAPSIRGGPLRRALVGQAMIDASWAMANRGGGRFDSTFMVGATLPSYPGWVGGTAAGVLAGDLIGNPDSLGLDAMFPAFFLGLLLGGELRSGGIAILVAAAGGVLALALIPLTPPGVPVIAASAAALVGLTRRHTPRDLPHSEAPAP